MPNDCFFLYKMLQDRDDRFNISHHELPPYKVHEAFCADHPYRAWKIIYRDGLRIGNIYLSKQDELAIWLAETPEDPEVMAATIHLFLRTVLPKRLLMNVAPLNIKKAAFVRSLGGALIQHTYELPL